MTVITQKGGTYGKGRRQLRRGLYSDQSSGRWTVGRSERQDHPFQREYFKLKKKKEGKKELPGKNLIIRT